MAKYLEFIDADKARKEVQPINVSAGAGDSDKVIQTDASGKIDITFLPDSDAKSYATSEDVVAGDLVNLHESTGTKARKANASLGVAGRAMGYVKVGVTSPAVVTVYRDGVNITSGMTTGNRQFLSGTTAGLRTETPPTTAGHIAQWVGDAESATEMAYETGEPIIRI